MTELGGSPYLAIIWHSRTGAAQVMAEAAAQGARAAANEDGTDDPETRVCLVHASLAKPDLLFAAAGYLFVCPENLGSMSGIMKDMFDRAYYPLLGQVEGRAYATAIAAGSDGQGAQAQIDRIVTGWRLRRVAEPVIVNLDAQTPAAILAPKTVPDVALELCRELGAAMMSGILLGVF
jgi:NAD(P)H-dependent FMN reductase